MLWTTALVLLPSCLRQRPKCTLLSCFNTSYNFYSFILPCEVIEQIPVIVIAFVYLKYSHSLSSKSKSAVQTTPCLELGQTPTKLYTLFRTERYVKNHTFFINAFLTVKQALKQCLMIFQIEVLTMSIIYGHHYWSFAKMLTHAFGKDLMSFLYVIKGGVEAMFTDLLRRTNKPFQTIKFWSSVLDLCEGVSS